MWLAAVKFSATPPAFSDMRKTFTLASFVKESITVSRWSMLMLPSSLTHLIPSCPQHASVLTTVHQESEIPTTSLSTTWQVNKYNWPPLVSVNSWGSHRPHKLQKCVQSDRSRAQDMLLYPCIIPSKHLPALTLLISSTYQLEHKTSNRLVQDFKLVISFIDANKSKFGVADSVPKLPVSNGSR